MYELFFKKFNERVPLTQEEQSTIESHLTPKKLRKKQFLLQEGDVCKVIAFVEEGALRSYFIDDKGVERIIQFALEGWIISDLYSFLTNDAATYNIDAFEHSELVLIHKTSHSLLLNTQPKYESYIRLLITDAYVALQKRITSVISLSLEERYTYFSSLYPDIVQRVPQHMIASFMGLTPETLSRIRRRISTNK
jgi:CRP-like cAMP-binding protein